MKAPLTLLFVIAAACLQARAELKVATVFQDHMVLQREKPVPVWGISDANTIVTVAVNGQTKTVQAGADGRWKVLLNPMAASMEPVSFKISSGGQEVALADVLVGEVWFASGQSNMAWTVKQSLNAEQEMANAKNPAIREFSVIQRWAYAQPRETTDRFGSWTVCSPGKVGEFSAVGYFFARELQQKLNIPVGIIHSALGGIPAESMTPVEALRGNPAFQGLLAGRGNGYGPGFQSKEELEQARKNWNERFEVLLAGGGKSEDWAEPQFDAAAWEKARPANERITVRGAVWLRQPFAPPAGFAGKASTLNLGPVEGSARVFLNGKELGVVGAKDGLRTKEPQALQVPAGALKDGENLLAMRVVGKNGGGFYGNIGFYLCVEGQEKWRLPEDGKKMVEEELPPFPPDFLTLAGNLFNGMVAPLVPYQIRGVIWYQGEANAGRAALYRELFPALIQGWRAQWEQPELPFFFVQLAGWMTPAAQPGNDPWALLREAQQAALRLPQTGMAVAIDIGDEKSIHPLNKQEVGRRLSLIARAKVYGERDLPYSGPIYAANKVEGARIRISFTHTNGGLAPRGGESLAGFSIADKTGSFQWAQAKIEGDTVVVWNDAVKEPMFVRYARARNPVCNLVNKAGLPAAPFRTDNDSGAASPQ